MQFLDPFKPSIHVPEVASAKLIDNSIKSCVVTWPLVEFSTVTLTSTHVLFIWQRIVDQM